MSVGLYPVGTEAVGLDGGPSSGGAAALAGNAAAAATATGTLTAPAGPAALTGNAQDTATATGSLSTSIHLAGAAADVATATGSLTGSVVLVTPPLKNNTGTLLASETGIIANVYDAATGGLVVRKTGLVSDAAGIVRIQDALLVAGTGYAYEIVLSGGARRLPVGVAA